MCGPDRLKGDLSEFPAPPKDAKQLSYNPCHHMKHEYQDISPNILRGRQTSCMAAKRTTTLKGRVREGTVEAVLRCMGLSCFDGFRTLLFPKYSISNQCEQWCRVLKKWSIFVLSSRRNVTSSSRPSCHNLTSCETHHRVIGEMWAHACAFQWRKFQSTSAPHSFLLGIWGWGLGGAYGRY